MIGENKSPLFQRKIILKIEEEVVHSVDSNRRFCGAKRTQCGASGLTYRD